MISDRTMLIIGIVLIALGILAMSIRGDDYVSVAPGQVFQDAVEGKLEPPRPIAWRPLLGAAAMMLGLFLLFWNEDRKKKPPDG